MLPLTSSAEHLDHFPIECRHVARTAARDQIAVDNDLLIYPVRSSVLEIGFERRTRGHQPAASRVDLSDGPWATADCRHRLAGVEERFRERHGLGLNPQRIEVDKAARQQKSIEVLRFGLIERNVDPELVTPFSKFPRADAFGLRRDDLGLRAGFVERLPRPFELDLSKPSVTRIATLSPFQSLACHSPSPSRFGPLSLAALSTGAPFAGVAWANLLRHCHV